MAAFDILPGRKIGLRQPCFIIAEIGQNHQGDINIAKRLIKIAKECGADCVKFQKSDLYQRFNKNAISRLYQSSNSWGATYGEHRKYLEFSNESFAELKCYASDIEIPFVASGMDRVSVDFLHSLHVPFFKVGSGDANNIPLLSYTAGLGKPVIISTGMQEIDTVCTVYNTLLPINKCLAILQCTSSYPTPPQDVNLNVIKSYQEEFPAAVIGYSGHEVGIGISIAAVTLGAKILERHLTIDRSWKGSDHIASLEPQEFKQMVNEIRNVEKAFGSFIKSVQQCESNCYEKLAKTVVAAQDLPSGTVLQEDMLDIKVAEPKGWKAESIFDLIGKRLKHHVSKDCSILMENIVHTE